MIINMSTAITLFKHRLNVPVAGSFAVCVLLLSPLTFVALVSAV